MNAAKDGSVLSIKGNVIINDIVNIDKNVTLKAASGGGSISTSKDGRTGTQFKSPVAFYLNVSTGKTLTLGDGTSTNELLLDEVNVRVTKGKLIFKDGVRISSTLCSKTTGKTSIVEISGNESSASFEGGKIENTVKDYGTDSNNVAVSVADGAQVDKISGGSYMSWGSAWAVSGENTKIQEISGGSFSNSKNSGLSVPCFLLNKKASIEKITGGNFRAYSRGALELQSAAHIGEISGGTFQNLYDTNKKPSDGSNAKPYYAGLTLYGREGSSPITVDKISGGTFTGVNGVLAVGNDTNQKIQIKAITGGTFSSIDGKDGNTGLYFTQNSEVDEISGNVTATGKNVGLYNAGTLKKISGGTFTGQEVDGLQNVDLSETTYSWAKNFKGHILEIAGGKFKGKKRGLTNAGVVDTISNGIFEGEDNAILCSNKTKKGTLSTIKNGVFYAKNDNSIKIVSNLSLEPDLATNSPEFGAGRYYAPKAKSIFNDDSLVTYPTYKNKSGENKPYTMSSFEDTKNDVNSYSNTGFRYLKGAKSPHNNTNNNTVTFKNGDSTVATVKVENGKAIDTDALTDQSMPANPTKEGYTFKEWNTKEDGKGDTFTGASVVMGDMTVYAIFTKNPEPTPTPTPTPTPNTPTPTPAPLAPFDPEFGLEPKLAPESEKTPVVEQKIEKRISSLPKTGQSASISALISALALAIAGFVVVRLRRMFEAKSGVNSFNM
ncbi:InlB B-repeat-containing protein [Bifidobacterium sp. UMB1197]|nr:InlB B-repeat-containing protein [Bifidobacterium sp. UMB1197]